jgi:Icc-related predicted phosphoesterase
MSIRIVAISDTHEQHETIKLPEGDILICSGDITYNGKPFAVSQFNAWFAAQPHRYKVLIAGNHDFLFEKERAYARSLISSNIIYLENTGCEIMGLKFWGSPETPWFFDWAFNRQRGADIRRYWDEIPARTDVLITHGPPFGILDRNANDENTGCEELLVAVQRTRPRVHIFGHIHEGFGVEERDGTIFVNASQLDIHYKPANAPLVVTLDV